MNNDWLSGMLYQHEFYIAFCCSIIEMRHFAWLPGPKFSIFYNTYIRYEYAQLCSQWCDAVEQMQMKHLVHTKE